MIEHVECLPMKDQSRFLGFLTLLVWFFADPVPAAQPPIDSRSMLTPWQAGGVFAERSRAGALYISIARDTGGPFPAVDFAVEVPPSDLVCVRIRFEG